MNLSKAEARLVTISRAIDRFDDADLVPQDDASSLASYLPAILPLDELEKSLSGQELAALVDGFIAGVATNRLMQAGVRPADLKQLSGQPEYQTGVDPVTNEVRVPN